MHCKFIKLINGDDIVAHTMEDCEDLSSINYITVIDPIMIALVRIPRGTTYLETYVMRPWVKFSKSDTIKIPTRNIVLTTDVHELVEEQYLKYLEDTISREASKQESEVDHDSPEPTQETLEDFIRRLGDITEEEDDERQFTDKYTRTFH